MEETSITLRSGTKTLVDRDIYEAYGHLDWRETAGYAHCSDFLRSGSPWGTSALHRIVMGLTRADGGIVHHVSGDRLDNRRRNLRVVTRSEHSLLHPRGKSKACDQQQIGGDLR